MRNNKGTRRTGGAAAESPANEASALTDGLPRAASTPDATPHAAPRSRPATFETERDANSAPGAGHPAPHDPAPVGRAAHGHARGPLPTHLPCPPPHTVGGCAPCDAVSPAERYQELFVAVQRSDIFADSKTFPDCVPEWPPEIILARYREQCHTPEFSLADFVSAHFSLQTIPCSEYVSDPDNTLAEHIDSLWPVLTREPREHRPFSSLLPLPFPYVVPGGRFGELYYWDSYFTMLGLQAGGRTDLLRAMTDNFAYLIETYGHVPNGTRSYYLSRSQPPVFSLMTRLLSAAISCETSGETSGEASATASATSGSPAGAASGNPPDIALRYLPQLRREHAFWMDGADSVPRGCAHRRVVHLPDGSVLNRYWDDHAHPREEAYTEDTETARGSDRPCHLIYRDLRAAAESGWDFSSRWMEDPCSLSTIRTTALLPVDLNALLWHAERQIASLCELDGDMAAAARYRSMADARALAMEVCMWDDTAGAWVDYDWHYRKPRAVLTAATAMPLYLGLGDAARARRVAAALESRLLAPGGIATTETDSDQQWDRANGWAPLQWIAIEGLRRHGLDALADTIAERWLATVSHLYVREGKLVEKYLVRGANGHGLAGGPLSDGSDGSDGSGGGGGGEYPLQDGFGWTNGVVRALLQRGADGEARVARAPAHR